MPRPIVGVGHSMGGCQIANLALIHPRLFETLILIDPVIARFVSFTGNISPAFASAMRRDRWPSREEAATAMKRNKFYQTWDPRVFDRWIQFGLRDLPTKIFPASASSPGPTPSTVTTEPTVTPAPSKPKEVTLTTTKHQEVMTFLRPNFPPLPGQKEVSSHAYTITNPTLNRRTHPDLTPGPEPQSPFYRGESILVFHQLPHLRPAVLYLFGKQSFLSLPDLIEDKMSMTGVGPGGSGGRKEGRVKQITLEDTGHLIPMEKVGETAGYIASWLRDELVRWKANEKLTEEEWEGKTGAGRSILSERYMNELKGSKDLYKKEAPKAKI
jgi:pimeloyl-ACP methyl ester carboxylesterase